MDMRPACAGSGFFQVIFEHGPKRVALPHAADVARIGASMFENGGGLAPERVEPAYLRNNVALTLAEQRRHGR